MYDDAIEAAKEAGKLHIDGWRNGTEYHGCEGTIEQEVINYELVIPSLENAQKQSDVIDAIVKFCEEEIKEEERTKFDTRSIVIAQQHEERAKAYQKVLDKLYKLKIEKEVKNL